MVASVLLTCVFLVTFSHTFFGVSSDLVGENGILEFSQEVLIAIAGFGFCSAVFDRREGEPIIRSLVMVGVCATFLLRETDVAVPGQVPWLSYWLDESGKKILLATMWLAIIAFTIGHRQTWQLLRRNFVADLTLVLLIVSAVALWTGWLMDREYFEIQNSLLIEETAEVFGYGMLFLASVTTNVPRRAKTKNLIAEVKASETRAAA